MKFNIGELISIVEKLPPKTELKVLADIFKYGEKIKHVQKGDNIDLEVLKELNREQFQNIEIWMHPMLLFEINKFKPSFTLPNGADGIEDLEKNIKHILFSNSHSRIKRYLISKEDILDDKNKVILAYDEEISIQHLKTISEKAKDISMLTYSFSDKKVILYINLQPTGNNYKERFYLNTNVMLTLISRINKYRFLNNLSKIDVESDLFIVDDPKDLYKVYSENRTRLIIIGDALEPKFRESLVIVKKNDPYARFMLAKALDPERVEQFLFEVELNYSRSIY